MDTQCCKGPIGLKKPDIMFKIDHATLVSTHMRSHIASLCLQRTCHGGLICLLGVLLKKGMNKSNTMGIYNGKEISGFEKIPKQRVYVRMCANVCQTPQEI